ncbi:MAG: PAS domain S-box protein [Lentisphaeria bacterium]
MKAAPSSPREPVAAPPVVSDCWDKTFAALADAVSVLDENGRVLQCNPAMAKVLGRSPDAIVGQVCWQLVHGTTEPIPDCPVVRARQTKSRASTTLALGDRYFEITADPILDADGRVTRVVHVMSDVTGHRLAEQRILQLNRLLRTISEVNQMIVRETNQDRLLHETCRILVESAQFRMVWVGFMEAASGLVRPAATAGLGEGYTESLRVRWDDSPEGRGPTGTAIRTGAHVVSDDVARDAAFDPWRDKALKYDFRSSAAFPLRMRDQVVGALSVYADVIDAFGAEEVALLDELAMDLGYALQTLDDRATRERAEAAERESQVRFRAVVETIPDLVWLKNPDGVYLACNRRFERFLGAAEAMIVGRTDDDFMPRELADFFRDHDRKAMAAAGPTINEEWVTFASDGHRELLETIKTPMYDPQGRLVGVLGISRDITGRKETEEALRNSEGQFRELFNNMTSGVAIYEAMDEGADFIFKNINETGLRLGGLKRNEVIGKTVTEVFPGIRSMGLLEVFHRVWKTGVAERYPGTQYTDARLSKWYENCVFKIPSGEIVVVYDDITERKQAEEHLLQAAAKRRELDFIINHSPAVVFLWKAMPGWPVEYVSENVRQFGYVPEDFTSGRVSYASIVHPDDLGRVAAEVARYSADPGCDEYSQEYRIVSPQGRVCWLDDRSWMRRNDRGEITHFQGIILDITERKQVEAEREKLQAQLNQAQKMESIGRLAGGVAHDFNNMLAAILGHAELALDKVAPAHPIFDDLQEIQKAAERSADLTRQLLAFARKQTVSPKVLDLNETVAGMLKMLRRLIREGIELVWLPGAALGPVKMDPSQLDQILANLAVNARDAIGGVGTFSIETRNAALDEVRRAGHADAVAGEYVELVVRDTGCGMSKDVLGHLFEPFFTTKGIGEGTGLGLATVYGIIRQNHGFVTVDSEPGRGTSFKIYLPRHHEQAGTEQTQAAPALPVPRGRETILLVEDEPAILKITATMLERLEYAVLPAATPGEAIRLAREHHGEIHLLMTDVVMPEMNGRDLAKNLLALYPHLKRLFMSGYTADVIAHHGVLDEGVNFIQKPFSKSSLAAKLREVLDA